MDAAARPSFFRRPALLLALLLGAWGAVKTVWEQHIDREMDRLRYQGVELTRTLRDQVGQGAMIGLLGGFRGVVADFAWLTANAGFQDKQWYKVKNMAELATTLQPRFVPFWDLGGWHMAWNASVDARLNSAKEPNELRRLKMERFWIDEGNHFYQRGLEANPESHVLWSSLARLHQQKYEDPAAAADYYYEAAQRADAPVYLERFPAIMWEEAGQDARALEHWKMLWERNKDHPDDKWRALDKIEEHIRKLEEKLAVPPEKRIFPTDSSSDKVSSPFTKK